MSNHPLNDGQAPYPPPAPPLPPQGYAGLAATTANAFARIAQPFGYGSRPPSAHGQRPADPRPSRMNVQRSSSPASSRSASHKTGIPIAALDISPDRTHAILAGRDILKTIQVSNSACAEDFNLRAKVIAYAATHETSSEAVSATHKDQLSANDVKWSHGDFNTTIATAASNGQIVVYDINRTGVEMARLHEHNRQVHRLGFNPHQGALMLSGSQDGVVRLWDLRDLAGYRSVMSCYSRRKFAGNSEGVRDLRWSPTDAVEFALGTDNGVLQRWDLRKENAPLLRINAHEKACHSIDWHPDGKHLVSGSADKSMRVWDFSSSDRRMKYLWQIRAPRAVVNVRWRPPYWSSERQGSAYWHCTQVAASYNQEDPRIHIWDFHRPHVPLRVIDRYDTPATALLWQSESLLWSVGSAGMFTQTDTHFTPKIANQRSPNTFDIAPDGRILFFSQKRDPRRTSIEEVLDNLNHPGQKRRSTDEKGSSSHGTSQGSFEESSLLSSSFKNRQSKFPNSFGSTRSSNGTPPPVGSDSSVEGLDRSLQKHMYQPQQLAGIGYIEGVFDARAFEFLARNYRLPSSFAAEHNVCKVHIAISEALQANAVLAARIGRYRLSQSWKILALAAEKELKARADGNAQKRLRKVSQDGSVKKASMHSINQHADSSAQGGSRSSITKTELPQIKALAGNVLENGSNMTTPLAKPLQDSIIDPITTPNVESFRLADPTWSKQTPKPISSVSALAKIAHPKVSHGEQVPELEGHEERDSALSENAVSTQHGLRDPVFFDMERQMTERRAAMGNYRSVPRPLLRLDDPIHSAHPGLNPPALDRHDSNDSFQLFSASTDSSHRAQSTMGSFESSDLSQNSTSTPERRNTLNKDKEYDHAEAEGDPLIFDDEAHIHPPTPTVVSPPQIFPTQVENMNEIKTLSTPQTGRRPELPEVPIVHHEDMEDCRDSANPAFCEPASESLDKSHQYILSDFLPPVQEPDYLPPWTASAMLLPLIDYHTYKLKDAQLPAYLLLHLAPYLHHSLAYERAMLILQQYHSQLVSLELYAQACELRNLAKDRYPEIAEHGLYQITPGGPWCTACKQPSKGSIQRYCERCKKLWAECSICNGKGPLSPEMSSDSDNASGVTAGTQKGSDALWGWCQYCGHGGHMGCLRVWWSLDDSEGACPTMGCLCDCIPGTRRQEIVKRLQEGAKPGLVSKDDWTVGQSPAVQKARGLVGGGLEGPKATSPVVGSSRGALSLGAAGRSGSGNKKVRIMVPQVDGVGEVSTGDEKAGEKASTSAP